MREVEAPDQGSDISPSTDKTERRNPFVVKRITGPLIKRPLAFLEAFIAIAGGGYGVYTGINHLNDKDNSPAPIHATVDPALSADTDRLEGLPSHLEPKPPQSVSEPEKKVNPDEVFDNEATKGVITPNMIKRVPEEEIQKLDSFARLARQKTEIITLRQPISQEQRDKYNVPDIQFVVGEDKNTIEMLYPLDFSQSSNPDADDAGIEYVKSYVAVGGQADYDVFHDKGYSNKIEFRLKDGSSIPKGTVVRMFVVNESGGYLVINSKGEGLMDIQAPNGNIYRLFVVALKGEGRNTKIVPFKPLVDAPEFTSEFNTTPVGTIGFNVVSPKPILQTSEEADRIFISLLVATKGKIGEVTRSRPGINPQVITNFAMFITTEGQVVDSEQ